MQLEEKIAELVVDLETIRRRLDILTLRHSDDVRALGEELSGLRTRLRSLNNTAAAK